MAWLVFILLVAAATLVSGTELWASSLTGIQLDTGHKYTLRYTAPTEATVLWATRDALSYYRNAGNVQIDSSFSDGQGESILIHPALDRGASVSLECNGSTAMYTFTHFVGERELPEVNLDSSNGEEWVYTPGEPFTAQLEYTNPPGDYVNTEFLWHFSYIDHARDQLVMESATSVYGGYERYISNVNTVDHGTYNETSADLNLELMEGSLVVIANYYSESLNMRISRGRIFAIKQTGHIGPFPADFLGLAPTYNHVVYCFNGTCRHTCQAFGPDVVKVELRMVGSDVLIDPVYEIRNKWFVSAQYQFPAGSEDGERVVCKSTNKNKKTVRQEKGLMTIQL